MLPWFSFYHTLVFFILNKLFSEYGTLYLLGLGLAAILSTIYLPRGIWGLLVDRTGASLLGVRRWYKSPLSNE